jgi:hypothetical protein
MGNMGNKTSQRSDPVKVLALLLLNLKRCRCKTSPMSLPNLMVFGYFSTLSLWKRGNYYSSLWQRDVGKDFSFQISIWQIIHSIIYFILIAEFGMQIAE